jgi:hypothetical protein
LVTEEASLNKLQTKLQTKCNIKQGIKPRTLAESHAQVGKWYVNKPRSKSGVQFQQNDNNYKRNFCERNSTGKSPREVNSGSVTRSRFCGTRRFITVEISGFHGGEYEVQSSGMYCQVLKSMSTDVSVMHADSIKAMNEP